MNSWIDPFADWLMEKVMWPFIVIFLALTVLGCVGGAGYGAYWLWREHAHPCTQKQEYACTVSVCTMWMKNGCMHWEARPSVCERCLERK